MNWIRQHKIVSGCILILGIGVTAVLLFLNSMFEEDGTEFVSSISSHVDAKSVLAVLAHPDDELSIAGALVRAAKEDGVATAVATLTPGDAGTQMPVVARQSDLGYVRKAEALKNTFAMGVDAHEVYMYPDGKLEEIPFEELVEIVRGELLQHRPDLVISFWPASGFTGHRDHRLMGEVAETAIRSLRASPKEGYAGPEHIAYPMAPTRMMSRFAGETGRFVVENQPPANVSQSGEAGAKKRGWKIHASQSDFIRKIYGFPAWFIYALYDKEFYYLVEAKSLDAP